MVCVFHPEDQCLLWAEAGICRRLMHGVSDGRPQQRPLQAAGVLHGRRCGDMTFDCYRDEELHYSFSFHHNNHIRIKGAISGDKTLSLASRKSMSDWLERIGVAKALEQARAQEEERRNSYFRIYLSIGGFGTGSIYSSHHMIWWAVVFQ